MGVLERRRIKEDLQKVEVFINDTNNEYFAVQDIPDTFTQGRSTFKIFGSPLLKKGVPLKIEILDRTGKTVYLQPIKYGHGQPHNYNSHILVLKCTTSMHQVKLDSPS